LAELLLLHQVKPIPPLFELNRAKVSDRRMAPGRIVEPSTARASGLA